MIRKNCGIYHQKVYQSPPVFLPNFYLRWVSVPATHSNQTNFLDFRGLTTRAQKPENQRCHFGWWKSLRVTAGDFHLLWELVGFFDHIKTRGEWKKVKTYDSTNQPNVFGRFGMYKTDYPSAIALHLPTKLLTQKQEFFYPKYIQTFTPYRIHGTNSIFTYHENHKDPPKW